MSWQRDVFKYDNGIVYEFYSQSDGTDKIWWSHDSEPVESWQELFRLIDGQESIE
jgi:hypothetical protein